MRNVPVNHKTIPALTWVGEFIGQVILVAFDPTKAQRQDYIRVQLKFDVSKPLRKSKTFSLPSGEPATVFFDYERVQKRCFECQRLTHERGSCPLMVHTRQLEAADKRANLEVQKRLQPLHILSEADPLFGVLSNAQVGLDPLTGRPRIAADVLKLIRQYMVVDNGDDKLVKMDRVQSTIGEIEKNPAAQRSILRLEPAPLLTHDVNQGKGLVFGYNSTTSSNRDAVSSVPSKLLSDAIHSGNAMRWVPNPHQAASAEVDHSIDPSSFSFGSTVKKADFLGDSSSGAKGKGVKPQRKRPSRGRRKLTNRVLDSTTLRPALNQGIATRAGKKRKQEEVLKDGFAGETRLKPVMVPNEGLSNI